MKVIRLNEQDIENLVKKIIKEEGFEWTSEVEVAPDVYKKKIDNWGEFVHYGKGTRWAPADPESGEKYYDMYTERYGLFTIYIDKDSNTKVACLSKPSGRSTDGNESMCYRENDHNMSNDEVHKLFKVQDLNDIPEI